jgi:hypothetical protein
MAPNYDTDIGVVSYARSSDGGAGWTQARRLSPASHVVWSPAVVGAAGKRVYVAWLRFTGDGYALWLRANTSYGKASRWSTPRRLGTLTGTSVSISAVRSTVFVTGRRGPAVLLWTSRDGAASWTSRRVASTRQDVDDPPGLTAVGAKGPVAAVAWSRGRVDVRVTISRDGGRHWSAAHEAGTSGGGLSVAVRHGRVAVAGSRDPDYQPVRTWVQIWRDGAWRALRVVPTPGLVGVEPRVVLRGAAGVGVSYEELASAAAPRVVWRTSSDDGRTWGAPVEVAPIPTGRFLGGHSTLWRPNGVVHVLFGLFSDPGYVGATFLTSSA